MKRLPRPLGLTLSNKALHRADPANKKQILNQSKQILIRSYIANNYTINNKYYTTLQLSLLLKAPTQEIQTLIFQYTKDLFQLQQIQPHTSIPGPNPNNPTNPKQEPNHNNLSSTTKHTKDSIGKVGIDVEGNDINTHTQAYSEQLPHTSLSQSELDLTNYSQSKSWDENISEIVGIGIGALFSSSLSDRALVYEQAMLLKRSQGETYKPFVSSEYTKALDLLLKTQGSFKDLIALVAGPKNSQTIQILNGGVQPEEKGTSNHMDVDDAIRMINSSKLPVTIGNSKAIEALNQAYGIEDLPTVNANEQGHENSVPVLISPLKAEEAKGLEEGLKDLSHQDRRAHELALDLDADEMPAQ